NVGDVENLSEILLYHVVSGRVTSANLSSGDVPTLNGAPIAVNVGSSITLNDDATVVNPFDVMASNGVIHTINAVLMPPVEEEMSSIVEIVVGNENFSILEAALIKANLVDALSAEGPFTVFAPTNAAFAEAGITSLDDFTAEELMPILLYHVYNGAVMAEDLSNGQVVPTLNENADFYLSINSNGVYNNGKTMVTDTDIEASNGVIHIIDQTLVPPTQDVLEVAVAQGCNKLDEALTEANLVSTLQGVGPLTVFAPTDAAFGALYTRLGVEGPAEIADATLTAVLTYHVVEGWVFSTDIIDGAMPETLQGGTVTINVDGGVTITDVDSGSEDATVTATDILGTNGVIHVIDEILIPVEL